MGIKITVSANTGSACRLFPKMIQYSSPKDDISSEVFTVSVLVAQGRFFIYNPLVEPFPYTLASESLFD